MAITYIVPQSQWAAVADALEEAVTTDYFMIGVHDPSGRTGCTLVLTAPAATHKALVRAFSLQRHPAAKR